MTPRRLRRLLVGVGRHSAIGSKARFQPMALVPAAQLGQAIDQSKKPGFVNQKPGFDLSAPLARGRYPALRSTTPK